MVGNAFLRLKADAPVRQQHRDKPCCICLTGAFCFAAAPTPCFMYRCYLFVYEGKSNILLQLAVICQKV